MPQYDGQTGQYDGFGLENDVPVPVNDARTASNDVPDLGNDVRTVPNDVPDLVNDVPEVGNDFRNAG